MAVALLCGGSKKHLHQGGLSTDQLLPLSYEKISAVDRSDLSDYTYMVLGRDKIMKGFKQINRALSFIPLEAAPDGGKNAFYLAQAGEGGSYTS